MVDPRHEVAHDIDQAPVGDAQQSAVAADARAPALQLAGIGVVCGDRIDADDERQRRFTHHRPFRRDHAPGINAEPAHAGVRGGRRQHREQQFGPTQRMHGIGCDLEIERGCRDQGPPCRRAAIAADQRAFDAKLAQHVGIEEQIAGVSAVWRENAIGGGAECVEPITRRHHKVRSGDVELATETALRRHKPVGRVEQERGVGGHNDACGILGKPRRGRTGADGQRAEVVGAFCGVDFGILAPDRVRLKLQHGCLRGARAVDGVAEQAGHIDRAVGRGEGFARLIGVAGGDHDHAVGAGHGGIFCRQQRVGTGRHSVAARERDGRAGGGRGDEARIIGRKRRVVARHEGIDGLGGGGEHVARAAGAGHIFGGVDIAAAAAVDHGAGLRIDSGTAQQKQLCRRPVQEPAIVGPAGAIGGGAVGDRQAAGGDRGEAARRQRDTVGGDRRDPRPEDAGAVRLDGIIGIVDCAADEDAGQSLARIETELDST